MPLPRGAPSGPSGPPPPRPAEAATPAATRRATSPAPPPLRKTNTAQEMPETAAKKARSRRDLRRRPRSHPSGMGEEAITGGSRDTGGPS